MANDPKNTIYIDVDDEITTVIDKMSDSPNKLVALVLPKRASVFQSIVNMKLLKRKADEAGKSIVLVTAEEGLLPLAGAVGLHVAKNLASKPEIPAPPAVKEAMVEALEDEVVPTVDAKTGEGSVDLKNLALDEIDKQAKNKPKPKLDDNDTIELDNTDNSSPTDTAMPAAAIAAAEAKKKAKQKKGLKIPNFERFRLLAVLIGSALLIIIVFWILLFKVWPHATIDIKTNAQNVNANLTFNLSTTATKLDKASNTVPAKAVSETKTYTATVNATGQQNNGQTASGSVTLTLTNCSEPTVTVPAGTGIVSSNLTYITQSTVTLTSVQIGNKCNPSRQSNYYTGQTNIVAQSPGSKYNVSNSTFSVPGDTNVSGTGSASGGTDDIVTIVSQTDINNAENKIAPNTAGAKSDLTSQLDQANYYPLDATFVSASPSISPNASAGTAANSVTVTETIKYSMYGVIKSDLNSLLNSNILSQVGANQNILSNGLANASYTLGASPTSVTLIANAVVGPNINVNILKQEVVGRKAGSIEALVKANSNVSGVTVTLSPFYVSAAPRAGHITINIAKPTNSPSNGSQ